MDYKVQTKATYRKSFKSLAQKFNSYGARVTEIEKTLSFISKENPFVLELGCSNGREAAELIKRTNNYIGIDYLEEYISTCQKNLQGGKFVVADIETFDFPQNLDVIFAFASLLHLDKNAVEKVLSRAYTALTVGGVFFISLIQDQYREYLKNDEAGLRVFYFYTPDLIRSLMPKGFVAVFEETLEVRGKKWFHIILRKE